MSFFETASLVLISDFAAASASVVSGSGTNTGKAYSIKPTDGSGDFDFERGSDITATRVNKDGYIEKGRGNFLLQSNNFDTTWVKNNANLTGSQSGYDGSNDAWILRKTGATGEINQTISSLTNLQTFSIYAKPGDLNWVRIIRAGKSIFIDLENQVTGSISGGIIDVKITPINEWSRISLTVNQTATNTVIFPADGDNDISGTSGFIYIQDAQLEQGLVATDYIETTTAPLRAGLLEDEPRFDYHNSASASPSPSASLLLEPSRTNLVTNSEYFEALSNQGPCTLTLEDINSPEGVGNAYSIVKRSATDINDRVQQNLGVLGTNHVFSIFLKLKSTTDTFNVRLQNNQGEKVEAVVSTDGTMVVGGGSLTTATNYDIENYGNGWYRLWMETTTTSATSNFYQILPNVTNTSIGECYFYGAQAEEGSYPTSYIPTYGAIASRGEDFFEKTGISSLIGQTEGTIFFEFDYSHQLINQPFFRIKEDVSNNYEIIALSTFKLRFRARVSGTFYASLSTPSVVNEGIHKAAMIYKSGGYKFYLDGTLIGTSTDSQIVSNPSEIEYYMDNNNLKQFLVFPEALSDAECITLTTL